MKPKRTIQVLMEAGQPGIYPNHIITVDDLKEIAKEFVPIPYTEHGRKVGTVISAEVVKDVLVMTIELNDETSSCPA